MWHMSCVTCHMSRVACHVSHVLCQLLSLFNFFNFWLNKLVELVCGWFVMNGPYAPLPRREAYAIGELTRKPWTPCFVCYQRWQDGSSLKRFVWAVFAVQSSLWLILSPFMIYGFQLLTQWMQFSKILIC